MLWQEEQLLGRQDFLQPTLWVRKQVPKYKNHAKLVLWSQWIWSEWSYKLMNNKNPKCGMECNLNAEHMRNRLLVRSSPPLNKVKWLLFGIRSKPNMTAHTYNLRSGDRRIPRTSRPASLSSSCIPGQRNLSQNKPKSGTSGLHTDAHTYIGTHTWHL